MSDQAYDWQSRKTLADSNLYMLTNKIDCDVSILVGQRKEKIEAHRFILISRSHVFNTMLKGSMSVDPTEPLHVPDLEPDIFNQFLLYLYTEAIQITPDNVMGLLYASKIYLVQGLTDKCLQKLRGKLLKSNLCLIMEKAHVFSENELRETCRMSILMEPRQNLTSDSLAELCSDCLSSIIRDDKLRMEEEEIFECVIKYSEEKCRRESMPVTPENQRMVLGDALKQIRFTQMDQTYFEERVEPLGILAPNDIRAVLLYFLNPRLAAQIPFNTAPRILHPIVKRFERYNAGWTYTHRNHVDAISFECDKNIQLYGVLTHGSSEGPKDFDAKISVFEQSKTLTMQVFKVKSDGHMKYYDCLFNSPVQIYSNRLYTIELDMTPGKTTYCGENGLEFVQKNGVTFKFLKSRLSMNTTAVTRGQIPGLIFEIESME